MHWQQKSHVCIVLSPMVEVIIAGSPIWIPISSWSLYPCALPRYDIMWYVVMRFWSHWLSMKFKGLIKCANGAPIVLTDVMAHRDDSSWMIWMVCIGHAMQSLIMLSEMLELYCCLSCPCCLKIKEDLIFRTKHGLGCKFEWRGKRGWNDCQVLSQLFIDERRSFIIERNVA